MKNEVRKQWKIRKKCIQRAAWAMLSISSEGWCFSSRGVWYYWIVTLFQGQAVKQIMFFEDKNSYTGLEGQKWIFLDLFKIIMF